MNNQVLAVRLAAGLLLLAGLTWGTSSAPAQSAAKAQTAPSEARLARVFQDNMVLQREKPVPIWGWAKAGTKVEVSFDGQKKEAMADEQGYWKALLDPMKANRDGQVLTAQIGTVTTSCKNVLVGEVWMAVGHSGTICPGPNVDTGVYPVYASPESKVGKPEIRFFPINIGTALEPWADLDPLVQSDSHWKTMKEGPEPVLWNQYQYFARVIRDKLDVPVGIIQPVCVGVCETAWMSRETMEAFPAEKGPGNCYQALFNGMEAGMAKNAGPVKSWADYKKIEDEWRITQKGVWPARTVGVVTMFSYPSVGYNTKIHPLAPYALKGVQFFAAPSPNTGGAAGIVALVKQWRKLFGQDFYFVNFASGYRIRTMDCPPLSPLITPQPVEDAMFEAQKLFGGEKLDELVTGQDLGGWMAHSMERAEAGRRLALATLALAYGQKLPDDGVCPRMAETKIAGNKATVRFDFAGEGMVYQPSIDGISGVYLRGKTGPGRWGQVKIVSKDTVEFSCPEIAELETVAYAHNVNSHETLFSKAGMPAAMFIVNPPAKTEDPWPPYQMLKMFKDEKMSAATQAAIKKAQISLPHIRRSGYVFQIIGAELLGNDMQVIKGLNNDALENSKVTIPVQAYIPAEWKGYEVVTGDKCDIGSYAGNPAFKGMVKTFGKPLKTTETTIMGARFVTFDAPADKTWVIVAEKGQAAEFSKINRY